MKTVTITLSLNLPTTVSIEYQLTDEQAQDILDGEPCDGNPLRIERAHAQSALSARTITEQGDDDDLEEIDRLVRERLSELA